MRFPASSLLLVVVLDAAAGCSFAHATTTAGVDRAFGYTLGDLVSSQVLIDPPAGATLDRESLPKPGRINAWFDLRTVALQSQGSRWRLHLTYQIMADADQVKNLFLPGHTIKYRNAEGEASVKIDAVPIAVAPMTGLEANNRAGLGELRPDRLPQPIDLARIERRLLVWGGLLALSLAAWSGYQFWRLRRVRQAPFERALRELRRLANQAGRSGASSAAPVATFSASANAAVLEQAFQCLHRAFDRTAGRVMLGNDLDAFLRQRPAYASLRDEIENFFKGSSEQFFIGRLGAGDALLDSLRSLAQRLVQVERRVQ